MQKLLINPVLSQNISGTVAVPSAVVDLLYADSVGIVLSPSGTGVTGTVNCALQVGNDGTNFVTLGTSTTVTLTSGTKALISYDRPQFHYARLLTSGITGGTLALSANVLLKTDTPTK